jgi:hypothetical protein
MINEKALKDAFFAGHEAGNSLSGSLDGDEEWEEYLATLTTSEPDQKSGNVEGNGAVVKRVTDAMRDAFDMRPSFALAWFEYLTALGDVSPPPLPSKGE